MTGQVKRLRADDDAHFTARGYLKLAHFVEKDLRSDLNLAKIERNIPLAGNEDEQAKVMGRDIVAETPTAPSPGTAASAAPEAETATDQPAGAAAPPLQESSVGEVSVVRPAIDQTLQAAQGLTSQGAPQGGSDAEMITSELGNGLTAVATLSSVADPLACLLAAAAAAVAAALLQGADQGRAAQAQDRTRRRFHLAAELTSP